jgi:hypothetical protein
MKVSVWQGFSSNHSARFTVVGVFASSEAAQWAANTINALAQAVAEWYQDPENDWALDAANSGGVQEPTPVEDAFAEQYGLDWGPYAVDWLWLHADEQKPAYSLHNLALVDGTESAFGAHPADKIVERLGGLALIDGTVIPDEEYANILVYGTCLAPDEATAEKFVQRLQPLHLSPTTWAQQEYQSTKTGYRKTTHLAAQLRREGRRLFIERGNLTPFCYGFFNLVGHLQWLGCSDFEYMLAEVREDDLDVLDIDFNQFTT